MSGRGTERQESPSSSEIFSFVLDMSSVLAEIFREYGFFFGRVN